MPDDEQARQPPSINTGGGSINTGGGPFIGGNQNVRGGQFNFQGAQMQGAILNIKSNLSHVTQSIGALPTVDDTTKDELKRLTEELAQLLQQVPPERANAAQEVSKRVEDLVNEAANPEPDKELVEFHSNRLKRAAENIAQAMPAVLTIATQIAAHISKLMG